MKRLDETNDENNRSHAEFLDWTNKGTLARHVCAEFLKCSACDGFALHERFRTQSPRRSFAQWERDSASSLETSECGACSTDHVAS